METNETFTAQPDTNTDEFWLAAQYEWDRGYRQEFCSADTCEVAIVEAS